MAKRKRTTHRSSKGTKLYAVRDKSGKFKDIQTYKRAHAADLRSTAASEVPKRKAKKKAAKKKVAKRKVAKRAVAKRTVAKRAVTKRAVTKKK